MLGGVDSIYKGNNNNKLLANAHVCKTMEVRTYCFLVFFDSFKVNHFFFKADVAVMIHQKESGSLSKLSAKTVSLSYFGFAQMNINFQEVITSLMKIFQEQSLSQNPACMTTIQCGWHGRCMEDTWLHTPLPRKKNSVHPTNTQNVNAPIKIDCNMNIRYDLKSALGYVKIIFLFLYK